MTDDVKDALELARSSAASKCQCLDCRALRALIPHIDGEPARLAAAREERDALRAERDEVTMLLSGALYWTVASELMAANHTRAAHAVVDELAALRAQVQAVWRWASESRPCACGHFVLRAMDEAKP